MRNWPIPVIVVSILFILAGGIGFTYHVREFYEPEVKLYELIWILFLRIVAITCGILLLFRMNLARWLAIAWLAYHVFIGALNSTTEMIAHIALLLVVSVLLFIPVSSAFFQNKNKQ